MPSSLIVPNSSLLRALCVVAGVAVLLSNARAVSNDAAMFVAEASTSWSSTLKPEIQIVAVNAARDAIQVKIDRVATRQCPHSFPEHVETNAVSETGAFESLRAIHTLEAGSWSHQNVMIGGGPLAIGCEVVVTVRGQVHGGSSGTDQRSEQVIPVKIGSRPYAVAWKAQAGPKISVRHVVEGVSFGRSDPFSIKLIRMQVSNQETMPLQIAIADRRVSCPSATTAKWELSERPVMQGMDNGPAVIGPSGWFVFEQAVRTAGDGERCTLNFDLSVQVEDQGIVRHRTFKTIDIPLRETGKLRL